jgi:hypothetical protein
VSLVSAALFLAGPATHQGQAFAAQPFSQLRADAKKVQQTGEALAKGTIQTGHALAKGTLKDYPKHLWQAIKRRPLRYSAMLVGIGALGAGAKLVGIDPAPFMVTLSAGTLGFAIYKSLPRLKGLRGVHLARAIGSHVVGPSVLAVGSTAAGLAVGHGPGHAVPEPGSFAPIGKAAAQSAIIGIDVPTIAQGALDQQTH